MKKLVPCKTCGAEIAKSAKKCPHCGAKNAPSAFWLIAALLFTVMFFAGIGGADDPAETMPHTDRPVATKPPVTTAPAETAPLGSVDNPYGPGMYKVGVDLPAGEYSFVAYSGNGYVCVSADSNKNDILENDNFAGSFVITVSDGQYLEASRCGFVRAADVVLRLNDDGTFSDGMYRVGIDIPAGEYKLTADGNGYYCIYPNSVPPFDIIDNDLFDVSTYVTVKDGQYLSLSRCTAVPVK